MKINILQTKNAETAPKIAKMLKNAESKYDNIEEGCFNINYGKKIKRDLNVHINKNLISNKLHQLLILKKAGILIPEIILENIGDLEYKTKNEIRKILKINTFPLLARKIRHSKGKDILYLKNRHKLWKYFNRVCKRDFLVKYIDKKAEFRVHVLGYSVPNICKKEFSEKSTKHHPHIWSSIYGWTLVNYNGTLSEKLAKLGTDTLKALNYDFGAIDIGLSKDNKLYVFEVNSAPKLNKNRRLFYAKFFRKKQIEHNNRIKNNV